MIRSAAAFIVLLFTAEVRFETVGVKYRGNVDLKTFECRNTSRRGAYRSAFVRLFSQSPPDCCAPASLLSNHDGLVRQ